MRCPSCSADNPENSRFCAACGLALAVPDDGATMARPATAPRPLSTPSVSSSAARRERFIPGTLLGDRFRIVAPLGRGGMGEVFRAEDLKLGQPVALKFLPPGMAGDADRLARLYAEVRIARQIAHPNVCRVYDIGEVNGEHFVSMEYIEGEDLGTLLRRIGRLPEVKGLQIARQIAAGVAAAHDKGVLHRDLKPANVMIDERGIARITDFGLASLQDDVASKAIEGTPAYMAPEQLAGHGASVRTDVYALGLVLFEIFTGQRAFEAQTVPQLMQKRASSPPPTPSTVTPDINPLIEAVIIQCLEKDPQNRPPSAIAVSASLPGGDPLAAALAAGETPSPEVLAAAGQSSGMQPMRALLCVAAIIASVIVVAASRDAQDGSLLATLPMPPEQLALRARDIATRLGYKEQPYRAYGFENDSDYTSYIKEHDKSKHRWQRFAKSHPSSLAFWYRESPRPLVPQAFFALGTVYSNDPPNNRTAGFRMFLESNGALRAFESPTPQIVASAAPKAVDWSPLFDLSGLRADAMTPAAPRWTPLLMADARSAWTGKSPDQPDIDIRLESTAYQGRIHSFQTIYPWDKPTRDVAPDIPIREKTIAAVSLSLLAIMLIVACLLARRNIVLGRGDRRGAFRFALAVIAMRLIALVLNATHTFSLQELLILIPGIAGALLIGGMAWLLYVAIEPYARKRWPQTLISWNRLLLGQFRDPVLGRDVLIGLATAAVCGATTISLVSLVDRSLEPTLSTTFLLGLRRSLGSVVGILTATSISAIATYLILFIFRVITRRDWLAVAIIILFNAAIALAASQGNWVLAVSSIVANTVGLLLLLRFGMVVLLAWNFVAPLLGSAPMTLRLSAWYGGSMIIVLVVLGLVTFWAFRTALAGRQVFSEALLET